MIQSVSDFWLEDIRHRMGIQIKIFQLNLVANGAILSFAISQNNVWTNSILACPIISFILFFYWVHQAIAIRLNPILVPIPKPSKYWHLMRITTFSIAILSNFVLIPAVSIFLYLFPFASYIDESLSVLLNSNIVMLSLNIIFYFMWFYLQYFSKVRSNFIKGKLTSGSRRQRIRLRHL